MSFIRLILVFCIIYAIVSIFFKRHRAQQERDARAGQDILKSLHDDACGVIFHNNTNRTLTLKLEITEHDKVVWTEHFKLDPGIGKMPFFINSPLRVSLSDDIFVDLMLQQAHHEYTVTIDPDGSMHTH